MLHPTILLKLGRAHQRDLLAEADVRRRITLARGDNASRLQEFVSDTTRLLTALGQSLQGASQQISDRRAVFAFKQDSLAVACEDPACAC